jgi:superkiller protein 3
MVSLWRAQARLTVVLSGACLLMLAGCASKKPSAIDYYIQGLQQARAGNTDQEISSLEKAVAANPKLRMAQSMLADAYRRKGDYTRAAEHYQAATDLDRYNFANHYGLGLSYQLLNRLQDAAVAYLRALQLNPSDAKTNMNLGLVFLSLGDMDNAEKYIRRATDLAPNNAQPWLNLGVVLDARGKLTEAESVYRRALELDSNNVVTLQNLAQNLIDQKKGDEAITLMEQAVSRSDTPALRSEYGDAFATAKEWDHAIAQYDLALKASPQLLSAINGKGFALIGKYIQGLQLDERLRIAALDLWKSSLRLSLEQPRVTEAIKKWETPSLFGN